MTSCLQSQSKLVFIHNLSLLYALFMLLSPLFYRSTKARLGALETCFAAAAMPQQQPVHSPVPSEALLPGAKGSQGRGHRETRAATSVAVAKVATSVVTGTGAGCGRYQKFWRLRTPKSSASGRPAPVARTTWPTVGSMETAGATQAVAATAAA